MTRERMTLEQAATVAEWRTDCRDWGERLKNGKSIIPAPIFPEEADYALSIFKELKIVDAIDSPTFGEASAQWVFDLVSCIFGAYDRDNGRRLITEFFVLIPKKNSKSTLAAGIMVTAILINQRLSAEFNIIAPTVEVADNSFKPSKDMIEKEDDVRGIIRVLLLLLASSIVFLPVVDVRYSSTRCRIGINTPPLIFLQKFCKAGDAISSRRPR
jgi:phage terminase large subunit-like protein